MPRLRRYSPGLGLLSCLEWGASVSHYFSPPPPPWLVQIQRCVAAELGAPIQTLFKSLDPFPLASATIAQVSTGPQAKV